MKKISNLSLLFFIIINIYSQMVFSKSKSVDETKDFPSTEYRLGLYQDIVIDIEKITHIIVVGSAVKEDSDQFFQSGLARAYRYKELYPEHQVIIISSPDVKNTTDEEVFEKYKILVIKKILEKFTAKNLLTEMNYFNHIASFDFFGHSSPWALKLGDTNAAFAPNEHIAELKLLKNKFLPDAFITLNACNTGFHIAPDLSEILEIPVSGSLTSSMFETISGDGYWYKEEDFNQKNYVVVNKFSYNKAVYCSDGLCNRMKSARKNYSSVWGNFIEGGLSFNKFFCNYNNDKESCERGMANSLYAFPSIIPLSLNSTIDQFKQVVFDWLCSTSGDVNYYSNCVNGIQEAITRLDLVFQSHSNNELLCDFKSCNAKILCKTDIDDTPIVGTCHLKTPINPEPTNVSREFLSLMKGYNDLNNNQLVKKNYN